MSVFESKLIHIIGFTPDSWKIEPGYATVPIACPKLDFAKIANQFSAQCRKNTLGAALTF